jgi:hypothetical protein
MWLARGYRLADYFFDLTQCIEGKKLDRVAALAKSSKVELMTHPTVSAEKAFLMSDEFQVILQHLEIAGLISLSALLLGFKYGSPEAIQEFVVRESYARVYQAMGHNYFR